LVPTEFLLTRTQREQGYFYFLLFLFMASMLGIVWADNLFLLFVFWEGTSITSYLLIGFRTEDKEAMKGARTAFVVTGVGGLAMLAGFVLLGQGAGSYTISELLAMPDLMNIPYAPVILILIFLGAFTKSAQFPFQFWLPGAMAAPTPASAYLHSATMVKAGVYLLARLHPAFAHSPLWFWSLITIGGFTMILGSVSAFRYYDLKKMLAYATVSFLGLLVMLLAFDSEAAYAAVAVGILAHGLYKGPLFMMAGIIDHATGTRDIRKLAGLWRPLPWVALLGVIAGLSLVGVAVESPHRQIEGGDDRIVVTGALAWEFRIDMNDVDAGEVVIRHGHAGKHMVQLLGIAVVDEAIAILAGQAFHQIGEDIAFERC